MLNHVRVLSPLLALALVAAVPAATDGVMTVRADSKLWVDGTSTVRSFSCAASSFETNIVANEQAVTAVLGGTKAVQTVDVSVPINTLDCKNGTMNDHMRKALKADAHPVITFRLDSYELAPEAEAMRATLTGTLGMGGVEKPVTFDANLAAIDADILQVKGSVAVNMKEFGLKPPSLMLGTMKVRENVNVQFELYLQQ